MAGHGAKQQPRPDTCCGVVEEAKEKSAARRAKKQPWIVLNFAVFVALGIIAYTFYVYVGRVCVPMLRRDPTALGGRGLGVAFLVVFVLLGLMMLWAYEKVLLTSPGLARDHVKPSPAPVMENPVPTWWGHASDDSLSTGPYQPAPSSHTQTPGSTLPRSTAEASSPDENVGTTDALPPVAAAHAKTHSEPRPDAPRAPASRPDLPKPAMFTRRPSMTGILLPQNRYCRREGFVKPLRAHHCRLCGTCVLRYDHHCPWIGQCVGARNYKFFVIFLGWALLFCVWTFATTIGLVARAGSRPNFDLDGQHVAILAFSGLFTLFTLALLLTHITLISANQTTVENLGVRSMKEREDHVLTRLHAWYEFGAKRRTRQQWDDEWGKIGTEGHAWWLGSRRRNWEAVMGNTLWGWLLPIGRSPDDGLSYEINPRFDAEGRWRPRKEWPAELR